ncbi:MAG: hypothetical protein E4H11_00925 [Myxococcales bacterium]|nr:MAG: hypothetical protein E4H11_00925 [Myxococcales bacterium]
MSAHALGELTRERLPARILFTIKRGGFLRPDVLVADSGSGPVVVKDWAPRSRPVRALLAGIALRREARAHRRLEGLACVPRLVGRLDARALVLEYRPGTRVSGHRPWIFGARLAESLARQVARVHARGVVHLDLSHRSNVGADPASEPVIFDLGAALYVRPRYALGRWLLRAFALADLRALRKWRRRLAPNTG